MLTTQATIYVRAYRSPAHERMTTPAVVMELERKLADLCDSVITHPTVSQFSIRETGEGVREYLVPYSVNYDNNDADWMADYYGLLDWIKETFQMESVQVTTRKVYFH